MNHLYLLVFNSKIDRDALSKFLDTIPMVTNWFYSIPNSIFVWSTMMANDLFARIEERFGQNRMFITEVSTTNRQGRMPTEHWNLIEDVGHVGDVAREPPRQ